MRRSERTRRLPTRYSPLVEISKSSATPKTDAMYRYISKNVKTATNTKTAAEKVTAAERTSSSAPSSQSLSKFAKSEEPTIAEIFGASPENEIRVHADAPQGEDIDVTGEEEPSKEPALWIEAGPIEAKGAPRSNPTVSSVLANRFGVPDLGFADLVSESAALPISSAPVNDIIIEGAAHVVAKPPQKTLAPQKKKLIQQHLLLLLHAYKCEKAVVTKFPCPVPFCSVMKKVHAHMRECKDGYSCSAPFCSSSRRIMCHWRMCKTAYCVVCSHLKNLAQRKRELKMKAAGQAHLQAKAQPQAQDEMQVQAQVDDEVQHEPQLEDSVAPLPPVLEQAPPIPINIVA